jgi:4-carboxymuconolactone decarboxylase
MKRSFLVLMAVLLLQGINVQNVKGEGTMAEERFNRGYNQLKALNKDGAEQVLTGLADIAPDMGRFIVEFGYGDIYARPALDRKARQIATVAALTALGNAGTQLKWHIAAALNVGVSPQEIVDTMYVMTVYAGFPAGLNGISAAREVFKGRNITFTPVKADKTRDRRERGMKIMEATSKGSGRAVLSGLADIAPDMADYIIDFSYGDIFSRSGLTPRLKEIAAIAGMTAAGTMRPQLKVHIKAALNVGVSKEEILEVLIQMAVYAGFPASLNGISEAREVFAEKEH